MELIKVTDSDQLKLISSLLDEDAFIASCLYNSNTTISKEHEYIIAPDSGGELLLEIVLGDTKFSRLTIKCYDVTEFSINTRYDLNFKIEYLDLGNVEILLYGSFGKLKCRSLSYSLI